MSKKERFEKKRIELLNHIRLIILKERKIGENYHNYQYPEGTKLRDMYDKLHEEQMFRESKMFQLFGELESISFS
jgi:hypothetical protein|tara:strand:- start:303 stop:527 length:225 start_codon:yes stop_codon:yes gene_type:complete